jgi:hypothetical protein
MMRMRQIQADYSGAGQESALIGSIRQIRGEAHP